MLPLLLCWSIVSDDDSQQLIALTNGFVAFVGYIGLTVVGTHGTIVVVGDTGNTSLCT